MIILVRHGRTAVNAGGRLLGRADPALDALGEGQAEALAAALAGVDAARLVTSPLGRARQTAAAVGARLGVRPVVDERWIELDYGSWDGLSLAELPAETWRAWRADAGLRPPGGETLVELGGRVRGALAAMAEEAVAGDVIVVSHVSPIKAAVAWALGAGDELAWRMSLAPASITRLQVTAGGAVLVSFNETGHLAGVVVGDGSPPAGAPSTTPR